MKQNAVFLSKLNAVLVQILKQDCPHNWPTFISDLVGASKTSESLCEISMKVLQLLSEEVFDYANDGVQINSLLLSTSVHNESIYWYVCKCWCI